jgi:glycosyltransferase involved in cell wall biosynthesis
MRVLYFSRSYTIHDYRFLSRLAGSGHEMHYAFLECDPSVLEKRPLPVGISLVQWAGGRNARLTIEDRLGLMPEFERVLTSIRPDLVHAGPVPSCAFMAALAGFRPLLAMSWGSDLLVEAERDPATRWMTCYALDRSDMLIADCAAVARKARRLVNYSEDRIVSFPWGVDLEVFTPDSGGAGSRRPREWEDSFVILSTRSWEPFYGIEFLLEAFHAAYRREPRLRLLLLGDGSLRESVKARIRDCRLTDVVYMPGQVPEADLPGYFQAANVFVSSVYSDGASISLLEAMATGLPVIVADNESNREWIDGNRGGLLTMYGDTKALHQALLQIAAMNPEQRTSWGRNNRRIVERRADWGRNFGLLLDAYRRSASMGAARRGL